MKNRARYFLATLVIGVLAGAPTSAGVTGNNIIEPFSIAVFVPCANGGLGELVQLSGRLHALFTETEDSAGGLHLTFHFQPMGVSGVGSDTGDVYRGIGVTRGTTNVAAEGFPFIDTFVNVFDMIGTAGGVKFRTHQTIHVTVNANGELSAEVDNLNTTCR